MNHDFFSQHTAYLLNSFRVWLFGSLLTYENAIQLGVLSAAFLFGALLRRPFGPVVRSWMKRHEDRWYEPFLSGLHEVLFPLFSLIFIWLFGTLVMRSAHAAPVISIAATLTGVWVIVRFISCFVRQEKLARFLALLIWGIAALSILDLLEPARAQLDAIGFSMGRSRITLLLVLKAFLMFITLIWLVGLISRIAERQVQGFTSITPSLRVLMTKVLRVLLLFMAFVITLNSLGIDLTSLAVFSGALGVGLGFGLQKVVSNFISGLILLMDRSIKPGDVIYIKEKDTYGWVNTLGARCVSVITRDGKEHLIPNESLITEKVENWSYSSNDVRIKINVAVSFDSDLREALNQMKEAAKAHPRVLKSPAPNALVRKIGDFAVELELRTWIDDPVNGIGNITSDILLDIWDRFKAAGIRLPYPQRDVHIIGHSPLKTPHEE